MIPRIWRLRNHRSKHKQFGFSLIELIIASSLSSAIFLAIMIALSMLVNLYHQRSLQTYIQDAVILLNFLAADLDRAGTGLDAFSSIFGATHTFGYIYPGSASIQPQLFSLAPVFSVRRYFANKQDRQDLMIAYANMYPHFPILPVLETISSGNVNVNPNFYEGNLALGVDIDLPWGHNKSIHNNSNIDWSYAVMYTLGEVKPNASYALVQTRDMPFNPTYSRRGSIDNYLSLNYYTPEPLNSFVGRAFTYSKHVSPYGGSQAETGRMLAWSYPSQYEKGAYTHPDVIMADAGLVGKTFHKNNVNRLVVIGSELSLHHYFIDYDTGIFYLNRPFSRDYELNRLSDVVEDFSSQLIMRDRKHFHRNIGFLSINRYGGEYHSGELKKESYDNHTVVGVRLAFMMRSSAHSAVKQGLPNADWSGNGKYNYFRLRFHDPNRYTYPDRASNTAHISLEWWSPIHVVVF